MSETIQKQSETTPEAGAAGAPAAKPTSLTITDKAVAEIKRIRASDPTTTNANLRVMVVGGGCSGMSYTLEYADAIGPSDEAVESDGVTILIDPKAAMFVFGTEMDYVEDKLQSGFVFRNPNEKGRPPRGKRPCNRSNSARQKLARRPTFQ